MAGRRPDHCGPMRPCIQCSLTRALGEHSISAVDGRPVVRGEMPLLPPATRLVFRSQVVDALRAAILGGRLQPGQPITERQLAHELQISRAPIREALRDLEKEGLIVTRPHKGTYIASYSDEDVREIYSLRATLETMALG